MQQYSRHIIWRTFRGKVGKGSGFKPLPKQHPLCHQYVVMKIHHARQAFPIFQHAMIIILDEDEANFEDLWALALLRIIQCHTCHKPQQCLKVFRMYLILIYRCLL